MVALSCPHCGDVESVIRFGTNRSGTARCRCKACGRTFTLSPRPRTVTPEKEQLIKDALTERISQRGIARNLRVSRVTIRTVRKKTLGE